MVRATRSQHLIHAGNHIHVHLCVCKTRDLQIICKTASDLGEMQDNSQRHRLRQSLEKCSMTIFSLYHAEQVAYIPVGIQEHFTTDMTPAPSPPQKPSVSRKTRKTSSTLNHNSTN